MIRVAVAAPSAIVRAGLEAVLGSRPDFEVLDDALRAEADVLLVHVRDEPPEGLPGASQPVVFLVDDPQGGWIPGILRAGVHGLLPADASPAQIVAAVEAAAAGLVVVHPDLREPHRAAGTEQLTARETGILRMLADGAANKTIAWKLGISEHTVKFHVASILEKLDAGSRTEAVTIGIRRGLIPL